MIEDAIKDAIGGVEGECAMDGEAVRAFQSNLIQQSEEPSRLEFLAIMKERASNTRATLANSQNALGNTR